MSRDATKAKNIGNSCKGVFSNKVRERVGYPRERQRLTKSLLFHRFSNKEPVSREELDIINLDELDRHLSNLEETVQEMNLHWKSLQSHRQQLLEHHYVLVLGSHLFQPG